MLKIKDRIQVLLVDDSEDEFLLTRAMFTRMSADYIVDWVDSYEKALVQLEETKDYDVLLIDYRLGERSGLDLLREPIIRYGDIPAILVTNHSDRDVDMAALEAGAADYLNKARLEIRMLERTIRYALERAQTLKKLRQSEARYRAIVEDQMDMIIRFQPDGAITFVNHAYCRFREKTHDELIGTSYLDAIHNADRHRLALENFQNHQTTTHEVRAYTATGEPSWQHWVTHSIANEDGETLEFQSVIRDITERKQVEEALNTRLEQLRTLRRVDTELTDTLNFDSVIGLALDSAMRLSAADIAIMALYDDETQDLRVVRSYGVADMSSIQSIYTNRRGVIGQVAESKQGMYIADMHANPDCIPTTERMISQMVIPLLSQESFLGVISLETRFPERFNQEIFDFIQLVTARIAVSIDNAHLHDLLKRRLSELEDLYAQVTKLEQLKTDIIRIASHDLRNPLGVMQGYIEILEWDVSRNKVNIKKFEDQLKAMNKAVLRMQRITTDILSLERFERRKTADDMIDMSSMLREIADEYSYAARDKKLTYELDVPDIPTHVRGDRVQLQEAAANLISNAIKYTPSGGTVSVILENDGDAVIFEVIDNGYGIPYEMQTRLFEPFYRAKTKETSHIDGTGLGLHLVKGIVTRHSGRMIFRSRYKEGSTFGFQIPTAKDK